MNRSLTVTFRRLPHSGSLESAAREVGQRLKLLNERMTRCHIVLEAADGAADAAAGGCVVKIQVSVPGAQIHAEGSCARDESSDQPRHALRVAYDNARRQLEKLNRQRAANPRSRDTT